MTRKITITYFGPEKKEETISVDDARIYVSVLSKNQIQLDDRICFNLVPRDNVVMAHVVEVHDPPASSSVPPPPVENDNEEDQPEPIDQKPIIRKPVEQAIIYDASYPYDDDTFFEGAPAENSPSDEGASSSSEHHLRGVPVLDSVQTSWAIRRLYAHNGWDMDDLYESSEVGASSGASSSAMEEPPVGENSAPLRKLPVPQNRNFPTPVPTALPKLPPPASPAQNHDFVAPTAEPTNLRRPPSQSRQGLPLVPLPRPQVQPSHQLPPPVESPIRASPAAHAPSPFRQPVLTTAPPTQAVDTEATVRNILQEHDRQVAITASSSTSSATAPRQPQIGRPIGYAGTLFIRNAANELRPMAMFSDAEIKQLFENGIKTLQRPPIVQCFDQTLCYAMFEPALNAIRNSDLREFTGILAEILFDFKVLDVAFMPRMASRRSGKLGETKPSHKRQLSAVTMQAVIYLIRYYTCYIDSRASKFDDFVATIRDSFNAMVDRRIRKARQQNGNVNVADGYKHLPYDCWNKHIPPFNIANAFQNNISSV